MSWPSLEPSNGGRAYSPGLPGSQPQEVQQSGSSERVRLPPLSTLLSGSKGTAAQPSLPSPSSIGQQEWSPLSSSSGGPATYASQAPPPSELQHHNRQHQHHRELQPVLPSPGFLKQQQQDVAPPFHSHQHPTRRASSISSPSSATVNLPPLTSLSIRTSGQSAPALSSSSLYANEPYPPRLPAMSSTSSPSYSAAHAPERRFSRASDSHSSLSHHGGLGPTRRRWTGGASSMRPYQRPASPPDHEYFGHVWSIYRYACRVNDAFGAGNRTTPSIGEGDVPTLVYYLNRELDLLDHRDARLSAQLTQEAGLSTKQEHSAYEYTSPSSFSRGPLKRSGRSDVDYLRAGFARSDQEDGRTQSDEMDLTSASSPAGSFTSPSTSYHASLPPPSYLDHRTKGTATAPCGPPTLGSPTAGHLASGLVTASSSITSLPPKRVRKRKDEADQSCLSCSATETPEWRKGPTGPRTLCNACGLLFAKQCRKKETDAQARGERPRGARPSGPEVMTAEEKQKSLIELRIAVNARSNLSPI